MTVTGGTNPPVTDDISRYVGTYTGAILVRNSGIIFTLGGATYSTAVSATGAVTTTITNAGSTSTLTGVVNAAGAVTFTGGTAALIFKITSGTIMTGDRPVFSTPFFVSSTSSTGATTEYALQNSTTFGTGGAPTTAVPVNLVGYRNRVGQTFQFTVTGSTRGAVWGTDVYTDDSDLATAAVHAGAVASGAAAVVTVTVLAGRSAYSAATRNGVSSATWGAWSGSYAFAVSGAVSGVPAATAAPAAAPGFTATTGTLPTGGRLVCPISVTGGGTYSYRWYLNGLLLAGATANPYLVESATSAHSGTYTVDVTNALGTTRLTAGTVTIGATGSPTLSLQPLSKTVAPGGTFTLAVSATGSGLSYQWFRNGVALPGETLAYLLRQNVNAADAGTYTLRVTNSAGSLTSSGGLITLDPSAARPANISCRTNLAPGAIVIPGFVVAGTGAKQVLIRAVGPGLAAFGVAGTLANPKLAVYSGSTVIAANDDWDATAIGPAFARTGAFNLTPGSTDAALLTSLPASPTGAAYTVQVSGVGSASGVVLIEVYDADTAPTSKLVNVSVRGAAGSGADTLILGLVIQGLGPRTLLVRGGGPALAAFGVPTALADPQLAIYDSNTRRVLENDDWSSAAFATELVQAASFVGAFAYTPGSKDAATLALLDPGAYTIQVTGANNATGEALVEVYEVP